MNVALSIALVAGAAAVACAVPGALLVVKRNSMTADAVSHALLPAIVLCFMLIGDLHSPLYLIAAAVAGLALVLLTELLESSRRLSSEAALGLVFPALFSIGLVLVATKFSDIHLDVDSVLLGEIALTPLDRFFAAGVDLGPKAFWTMSGVALVNIVFVLVFFKEIKIALFDSLLAQASGFRPRTVHYLVMGLVSLTAVAAFEAVGAVLVVAMMIAPAAAARLVTRGLGPMITVTVLFGVAAALIGFGMAYALDTTTSGTMALANGMLFIIAWMAAPSAGFIAQALRAGRRRLDFGCDILLVHLSNHERQEDAAFESTFEHLQRHMGWASRISDKLVNHAVRQGYLYRETDRLRLSETGRARANEIRAA